MQVDKRSIWELLDHETYGKLTFEERLGLLVDAEWGKWQSNKLDRYIRNAQFSNHEACIEGIEYHPERWLDKEMGFDSDYSQGFAVLEFLDN